MQFLIDNIVLVAAAIASGVMLLLPTIQRRGAGSGLDTLAATRLINDSHAVVVDVREPSEFAAGHLPNARNIPVAELERRVGELPGSKPVLLCCATGVRSGRAAATLGKDGRQVFNLAGGLKAWREAGLPLVR